MNRKSVSRRLAAIFLTLSMCLSLLPATALAAAGEIPEELPPVTDEWDDEDGNPDTDDGSGGSALLEGQDPSDENEPVSPGENILPPMDNGEIFPAAEGDGYTLVTGMDDITSGGQFVLVAKVGEEYYALGTTIANKITKVAVSVSNNTVTSENLPVWVLTPENSGVSLFNGTAYLGYVSGTNFKSQDNAYQWNVEEQANGTFRFTSNATTTRGIALDTAANFGAYATSNATNSKYVFDLFVFKNGDYVPPVETKVSTVSATPTSGSTVAPGATVTLSCRTAGVTYHIITNDGSTWTPLSGNTFEIPSDATSTYSVQVKATKDNLNDSDVLGLTYTIVTADSVVPISDARAGTKGETYVVSGTVTLISSGSVYIQDTTGGICLRISDTSNISAGMKLTAYGTWSEYNKLLQLNDAVVIESEPGTLPTPKNISIAKISEDVESQLIQLTGAKVTAINGTTVTLSQGEGAGAATTTIYKCPQKENLTVGDTITVTAVVSQYQNNYQLLVSSADDIDITDDTTPDPGPVEPPKEIYKPANGDKVAIYYPAEGLVMTGEASGTQLKGAAVPVSGGNLFTNDALILTATVDNDGYYTFTTDDGRVLNTGATGGNLTLVAQASAVCTKWELIKADSGDGWLIRSTQAAYNGNKNQHIEVFRSNFTTYSLNAGGAQGIYTMEFFKEENIKVIDWTVDNEVEQTIAQWGGGSRYEDNALSVNGDLLSLGDMLDSGSVYTAVSNGNPVKPFTTGKSAGSSTISNWYMGGSNIGSGSDDYLQFKTTSKGWGGMKLSFRLRTTNAAAGSWQLQYSSDGTNFANFGKGSYTASYTQYSSGGVGEPVTKSGDISDGVAKTSVVPGGTYISFTFDVPIGAENADELYIRLVPGTDKVNGTGTVGGTVRIDTVKLAGSPIVSSSVTPYVNIEPDNTEDIGAGAAITLTAESGATVHYGWANNTTGAVTYTEGTTATVPADLPATLFVYASSAGKADSVVRVMTYRPASVASVQMEPNGGGVYLGEGPVDVLLTTATEGATIYYSLGETGDDGNLKYEVYDAGTTKITLNSGFGSLTVSAYAKKDGFSDSAVTTRTFTERSSSKYQLFFGQMHSHTSYSDGAGTAAEAFRSVKALNQETWNMDFVSITDHSNSFDDAGGTKRLADAPTGQEWNEGKQLAREISDQNFVGLFGYEMTWSNGLGHINTFNTPGYQDRTQSNYTTYSTALQNYYEELKTVPTSISQFNHPGTTFGDFSDFAHYDEEIDRLITLIEVGNGEGAIGSSGYFPSYEYYTRALDKGWHVAPTNNQDNHKGGWGTSNTGRDVVLVDELTEEAIYDAMRNYRVYATEDLNLEIYYMFDGNIMGSILEADSYGAGSTAKISVELKDPNGETATVEVIVNGGRVLQSKTASCNETVEFSIENPADYSYYYIKVTQNDGDIAVTAPVWVGEVEAVGITSLKAENAITVTGQPQKFTLELYNNETKNLEVSSIVFTDKATGATLFTATDVTRVPKLGSASTSFSHTFTADGVVTVTATVRGTLNGVEKVYTQDLELTVMPVSVVNRIVVDGSHYNDYVTGYYGGRMGNMTTIAAGLGVEVVIAREITQELLDNCQLLVISAPARRAGSDNAGAYEHAMFEDSFIALVKQYVEGGGSVAVCGLADYQDKQASGPENHAAAQINKLLEAIGSTLRINDDQAMDDTHNGGQVYRLYPETFNMSAKWCRGIIAAGSVAEGETYQTYSQYSGCTVDPGSGTWLVKGFDTTYAADSDNDGLAVAEKGNVCFLACEDTPYGGTVFAAGGVFLSDFEVAAELDNIWDLPYANRTIYENILSMVRAGTAITPIAETRKAPLNKVFAVEGYVTSGTTNPNTTFFDSIYVQDASGGTDVFPYATPGLAIGTKVRVLGYTDAYQGDRELQVLSLEVLDAAPYIYQPKVLTTAQATDYGTYGGQLVSTSGVVSDIVLAGGRVSQFRLTDQSGTAATVFIDGYITNENGVNNVHTWLQAGQTVSAVGLLYSHPEGDSDVSVPVLRVRNCDEITQVGSGGNNPGDMIPDGSIIPIVPGNPSNNPSVMLPVTTGTQSGVASTLATPEATVSNGVATLVITPQLADEIVRQAVENSSSDVVIAPYFGGSVSKSEVSIPASAIKELAEKTDANLTIRTPIAIASITNEGLHTLANAGSTVTITTEKTGNTSILSITADGKDVGNIPGGVVLTVPVENTAPGMVAILVNADGTQEVIRKSVAVDGAIQIPLSGSASVKIVDNSKSFMDVTADSWGLNAVRFVSAHELFGGTGDGVFSPNLLMTRGMLAVVLHNLEGNPETSDASTFADVAGEMWYADAIAWTTANGIVNGDGNGLFRPNDSITREELAVMLWRYAGSPAAIGSELHFNDSDAASGYALEALRWAAENGVINGKGGGILDPKGLATRMEAAQMMMNFICK